MSRDIWIRSFKKPKVYISEISKFNYEMHVTSKSFSLETATIIRGRAWYSSATPPDSPASNQRPTIVMLHGSADSDEVWSPIISNLLALDSLQNIITLDLPGHGESEWQAKELYELEDMSKLVFDAILKLDLKQIIIVGHSLGASIALKIAHYDLEAIIISGLILVDPALITNGSLTAALDEYISSISIGYPTLGELEEKFLALLPLANSSCVTRYLESAANLYNGQFKLPFDPNIHKPNNSMDDEVPPLLESCDVSFHIISGAYSAVCPKSTAISLARRAPKCLSHQIISMSGHAIPFEQPDALSEAIAMSVVRLCDQAD